MTRSERSGVVLEGSSSFELAVGQKLASRYLVDEPLSLEGAGPAYLGTDEQTGKRVILFALPAADAAVLDKVVGLAHAHLATLFDVLPRDGGDAVVVAEHVPGETLEQRLQAVVKKTPVDAVRSALRVADALSHVHDTGGVHGCVRGAGVVLTPEGRAAPVLGFVPPLTGPTPFHSPERGESGPPSESDDTWAVAGLLYEMLVGAPPPAHGLSSVEELDQVGVSDDVLQATLLHALKQSFDARSHNLRPFKRELARWFVDHADDSGLHHDPSHPPPPLPPGASSSRPPAVSRSGVPAVSTSKEPSGIPRRRLIPMFAVGAILLGLVAAWGVSAFRARPKVKVVHVPPSAKPATPASAKEIKLSDVPVTGKGSGMKGGDHTAACVAGYLPQGAFGKTPDLGWMCSESDPREGAGKLRTAIVTSAPHGNVTDAMKLFSKLGWYDMAAYAVIRSGCCTEATPLELPKPAEGCPPMDQALRELGRTVVAGQPHAQPLASYKKAVQCEVKKHRAGQYRHKRPPRGGEESAFEGYVKTLQTP